jgi:hypothetical protein
MTQSDMPFAHAFYAPQTFFFIPFLFCLNFFLILGLPLLSFIICLFSMFIKHVITLEPGIQDQKQVCDSGFQERVPL